MTGEHQPEVRPRTGPCLRLAFGSDRTDRALGPSAQLSGMSAIDGANGRAIRMIPSPTAWDSATVSKTGRTNPARPAWCIQFRGDETHLKPVFPGWS